MKKLLFILFYTISLNCFSQTNPIDYLKKDKSDIIYEFKQDTIDFKIKESKNCIDIINKEAQYIMKFIYDSNNKISIVVFATSDHETAQIFFDFNDDLYFKKVSNPKKVLQPDGSAQWIIPENIIIFKIQNHSEYQYQFTYLINNYEKRKN